MKRQQAYVCNIWQLHGPGYMYICICAWTVFPVHFSATQSHSRVQVHTKQMSSAVLVYVYGLLSLWCCFVSSYKGETCWQMKREVHPLTFLSVFRSYALGGRWVWMTCFPDAASFFQCCQVSVCVCLCAVLVRNQSLCHRSGLELVTCLGSPADDVPYWETVPAGFPNCAFRNA